MSARILIDLPDGHQVLFGGSGSRTGLSEVSIGGDIARASSETFKAALGSLAGLASALEGSLGDMAKRPDKVEMEFGASLTGDCNLWIVSGEGQAEFKVTLSWEKSG
jgi:hypothetical protein